MKTTLYITRHGQTLWNIQQKMQGWKDSPLTEEGLKQAENLRERMENIKLDMIYTSPIGRASKTAKIVRGTRPNILIEDKRIREISMGIWEGMNQEDIKIKYKEQLYNFWNNPDIYKPFNGETFYEVRERVSKFLDEILEKNKGKNILVVTHTIALKCMMSYLQSTSIDKLWNPPYIHPTSLTKIEINEEGKKIILNADASHLKNVKEIKAI